MRRAVTMMMMAAWLVGGCGGEELDDAERGAMTSSVPIGHDLMPGMTATLTSSVTSQRKVTIRLRVRLDRYEFGGDPASFAAKVLELGSGDEMFELDTGRYCYNWGYNKYTKAYDRYYSCYQYQWQYMAAGSYSFGLAVKGLPICGTWYTMNGVTTSVTVAGSTASTGSSSTTTCTNGCNLTYSSRATDQSPSKCGKSGWTYKGTGWTSSISDCWTCVGYGAVTPAGGEKVKGWLRVTTGCQYAPFGPSGSWSSSSSSSSSSSAWRACNDCGWQWKLPSGQWSDACEGHFSCTDGESCSADGFCR